MKNPRLFYPFPVVVFVEGKKDFTEARFLRFMIRFQDFFLLFYGIIMCVKRFGLPVMMGQLRPKEETTPGILFRNCLVFRNDLFNGK